MHILHRVGMASLAATTTLALATESAEIFDMDFSQLNQVQVSVASARVDAIVDAPGIVSYYAAADLEKLGLRSLRDMLSFVPGFVLQDTAIGTTAVAIRGLSEGFNQKMLLLLDDVPYWMPTHSDAPLLGIPLEAIDHIEIIRGPASLMYGTNASAGLVRVVTKKRGISKLALSAGSHGLFNSGGYWSQDLGADQYIDLAVERQRDGGYSGRYTNAPAVPAGFPNAGQTDGSLHRGVEMDSMLLHYHRGAFNFALHGFEQVTDGLALTASVEHAAKMRYNGRLAHADYSWNFDRATLKLYTDWNNFYIDLPVKNGVAYGIDGGAKVRDPDGQYRWRSGALLNLTPGPQWNVSMGTEYEKRTNQDYGTLTRTGFNVILPANKSDETSLFAQGDYTVDAWRFLLGARYVTVGTSGGQQRSLTPRLGVVYKLDDTQSLKRLQSTGFNTPNAVQSYFDLPGIVRGDPNLKAETVATTDFAYAYSRGDQLLVVNLYALEGKNFIGRHPVSAGLLQYFNTPGEIRRWGVEVDYQRFFGATRVYLNMAYNHQGNENIPGDLTAFYTPKLTLASGGSYRWAQNHVFGGTFRFVGGRANAASITMLDLNYQYEQKTYETFVTLRNALDQEIMQPDMLNFYPGQMVNGGDRRNLLAGVKFRF